MRGTINSTRYLLLISIAPFLLGIIISLISKKLDTGESA